MRELNQFLALVIEARDDCNCDLRMKTPQPKAIPYPKGLCVLYEFFIRPLRVFECDGELSAKRKAARNAIFAFPD
jgi:hypothetical protein